MDELHTIPSNIVAKRVVYNKGDQYKPKIKNNCTLFSTIQLPIRDWKDIPNHVLKDPNFKDFRGYKFGNFKVIGIFALDKFDKWVCKCCCGCYEIRKASILNKNPTSIDQTRCSLCMDLERIRNKDFFKKNGQYPWQNNKKKNKKLKRMLNK